jgi:hypothetical protein
VKTTPAQDQFVLPGGVHLFDNASFNISLAKVSVADAHQRLLLKHVSTGTHAPSLSRVVFMGGDTGTPLGIESPGFALAHAPVRPTPTETSAMAVPSAVGPRTQPYAGHAK